MREPRSEITSKVAGGSLICIVGEMASEIDQERWTHEHACLGMFMKVWLKWGATTEEEYRRALVRRNVFPAPRSSWDADSARFNANKIVTDLITVSHVTTIRIIACGEQVAAAFQGDVSIPVMHSDLIILNATASTPNMQVEVCHVPDPFDVFWKDKAAAARAGLLFRRLALKDYHYPMAPRVTPKEVQTSRSRRRTTTEDVEAVVTAVEMEEVTEAAAVTYTAPRRSTAPSSTSFGTSFGKKVSVVTPTFKAPAEGFTVKSEKPLPAPSKPVTSFGARKK